MGIFDSWFGRRDQGPSIRAPKVYRFTPCQDITAYELALILRNVDPFNGRNPLRELIMVNPMTVSADWYRVARHFTLVTE